MEHGLTKTRLYRIHSGMKQRCYNPNATGYKMYGGKGITICQEWLNDFRIFYDWSMKNGYSDDLTIDRIDSTKGYSPENCRWITFELNYYRRHYEEKYAIGFAKKNPFHGKLGRPKKSEIPEKLCEDTVSITKCYPESNLRKIRIKRSYTMENIAYKLNTSLEEYQLIEMGELFISNNELLKLAKAFRVSIEELFPLPEPTPHNRLLDLLERKNLVKVIKPKLK